ncbi:MAG: hypothetical protein M1828_001217, partial [Chrysothrix sp. TS-e1954]
MESRGAVSAIYSLLLTSSRFIELVNRLSKSERSKVDAIDYELIAELERLRAWVGKLTIADDGHLRPTLNPEQIERVFELLTKAKGSLDRTFKQHEATRIVGLSQAGLKRRLAKVKFFDRTASDSEMVFDALIPISRTLRAVELTLSDFRAHASLAAPLVQPTEDCAPELTDSGRTKSTVSSISRLSCRYSDVSEPARLENGVSVRNLFLKCTSTLHFIAGNPSHDGGSLRTAAGRLDLWGSSIFTGHASIDRVFDEDPIVNRPLRRAMLDTFVYLLVEQVRHFLKAGTYQSDSDIRSRVDEIMLLLGDVELCALCLNRWEEVLLDDEEGCGAPPLSKASSIIEILFDLLPAVSSARRCYCLHLEDRQRAARVATLQAKEARQHSSLYESIHIAMRIVSNHDLLASEQSNATHAHVPVFRKERERLEEFYASQGTNVSSGLDENTSKLLQKKESQINQYLSHFARRHDMSPTDGLATISLNKTPSSQPAITHRIPALTDIMSVDADID